MAANNKNGIKAKTNARKRLIWALFVLLIGLIAMDGYLFVSGQQQTQQSMNQIIEGTSADYTVEQGVMYETVDDLIGTIRPRQSVDLVWQTTGTVGEVLVTSGQLVKKGDILAVLDPGSVDSAILAAEVTKEEKQTELERLYTSTTEISNAYNDQVLAQKALAEAEKTLSDLGVVRKDKLELGVYYQDYLDAKANYDEAVNQFNTLKTRPLDDFDRQIAVEMMSGARSEMEQTLAKYNWYNGEVDTLTKQQAEADVILKEAELKDAQRAYDKIKDGPTDNQIRSLQSEIDAAQALSNTDKLIAPVDGTVTMVDTRQFDVITQTDLNQVTPKVAIHIDDLSSFYINVQVSEMKINSVAVGQKVQIRLDAIPLRFYTGQIYRISNAGELNGGEVTFDMVIKMEDADEKVKPGMSAELSIQTKEIPDALFVPQSVIGTNPDETKYVIKQNDQAQPEIVIIETGVENDYMIQVISPDLKAGDRIYADSPQLIQAIQATMIQPGKTVGMDLPVEKP